MAVFNDRGRFRAEAQVSDDVGRASSSRPLGYWASNSPNGRSANVVNASRYADLGRAPTFSDTRSRCGGSRVDGYPTPPRQLCWHPAS